ncbi:hypothetical protein Mapa_012969 [Marchantia paleacea]|nr:hypothetical protein Mapa_012969 [Marchantia paleacea]
MSLKASDSSWCSRCRKFAPGEGCENGLGSACSTGADTFLPFSTEISPERVISEELLAGDDVPDDDLELPATDEDRDFLPLKRASFGSFMLVEEIHVPTTNSKTRPHSASFAILAITAALVLRAAPQRLEPEDVTQSRGKIEHRLCANVKGQTASTGSLAL